MELVRREFVVDVPAKKARDRLAVVEPWPEWAKHIEKVSLTPPGPLTSTSAAKFHLAGGARTTFRMELFEPPIRPAVGRPLPHLTCPLRPPVRAGRRYADAAHLDRAGRGRGRVDARSALWRHLRAQPRPRHPAPSRASKPSLTDRSYQRNPLRPASWPRKLAALFCCLDRRPLCLPARRGLLGTVVLSRRSVRGRQARHDSERSRLLAVDVGARHVTVPAIADNAAPACWPRIPDTRRCGFCPTGPQQTERPSRAAAPFRLGRD